MADTSSAYRLAAMLRDVFVGVVRRDGTDLSARQFSVLLICLEYGPHTVRGLAERLNVAQSAITRAVDRIEQFDMAKRKHDLKRSLQLSYRTYCSWLSLSYTVAGSAYVTYVRSLMQTAAKTYGVDARAPTAT